MGAAVARGLAGIAACGVGLLATWQPFVVGLTTGPRQLVALSAAGVAAGLLLIIAHELGHAIAGWALGMPPLSMTLVFVRIDWEQGRAVLRPNTRLFRPVGMVWPALAGAARWRRAVMVAAGPATNLALAAACLAAAAAVNPGPSANLPNGAHKAWQSVAVLWPGSIAAAGLNMTGLASLLLGVQNLIPGWSAGFRTDGGQLLDLARARQSRPPPTEVPGSG